MKNLGPKSSPENQSETVGASGPSRSLAIGLLFLALWLLARSFTSYHLVFPEEGGVVLSGPDSYHHLRHTKAILDNYPWIARYDEMSRFPQIERGLNQGFFDLALATVVKATGGLLTAEFLLAWNSALLSGAAILLVAYWLREAGLQRCALGFLLIILAYPGALRYMAALGEGDHHASEVLLAVLCAVSLHFALQPQAKIWLAALAAVPMFVFAGTWAGAPLHLFLVGLIFYAAAWLPTEPTESRSTVIQGCVYGATLATLLGGTWVSYPDAAIWETAWAAMLGCSIVLVLGYPLLGFGARMVPTRFKWPVALLLLALFFSVLWMHPAGRYGLEQLFYTRPMDVAEHPRVTLKLFWHWYGFIWLGLPLSLILWFRYGSKSQTFAPVMYGTGLVLLWIKTYDFIYYPPMVIALAFSYLLWRLETLSQKGSLALLTLACLIPLLPQSGVVRPWLQPTEATRTIFATQGIKEASDWLKRIRDEEVGPDGGYPYGMLAPWDLGNMLAALSDTPVAFSQERSERLAGMNLSQSPEEVYTRLNRGDKPVRFVLVPMRSMAETLFTEIGKAGLSLELMLKQVAEVAWDEQTYRIYDLSPLGKKAFTPSLFFRDGVGTSRFRLVYESPRRALRSTTLKTKPKSVGLVSFSVSPEELQRVHLLLDHPWEAKSTSRGVLVGSSLHPEVKIFEGVPGALIVGQTRPLREISVELDLEIPTTGKTRTLSWKLRADRQGHFEVRLPYATDRAPFENPDTVRTSGHYRMSFGGSPPQEVVVVVTEEQVQNGTTVVLEQP